MAESVMASCLEQTQAVIQSKLNEIRGGETDYRVVMTRVRANSLEVQEEARSFASVVIGRQSEGCDYVVEDKAVSRMHCAIYFQRDHLVIRDLYSRSGTFVNGVRIPAFEERALQAKDLIQVNEDVFIVCEIAGGQLRNPIPTGSLEASLRVQCPYCSNAEEQLLLLTEQLASSVQQMAQALETQRAAYQGLQQPYADAMRLARELESRQGAQCARKVQEKAEEKPAKAEEKQKQKEETQEAKDARETKEAKKAAEKAEKERKEAEKKAEREKAEADKKAEKERKEAEKKAAAEKEAEEKLLRSQKIAEEKLAKSKRIEEEKLLKSQRIEAEKAAAREKAEAEKLAKSQKIEAEKLAKSQKAEAEKLAKSQKAEAEKLAKSAAAGEEQQKSGFWSSLIHSFSRHQTPKQPEIPEQKEAGEAAVPEPLKVTDLQAPEYKFAGEVNQ